MKAAASALRLTDWFEPTPAPVRMFRADLLDHLHPPLSHFREF